MSIGGHNMVYSTATTSTGFTIDTNPNNVFIGEVASDFVYADAIKKHLEKIEKDKIEATQKKARLLGSLCRLIEWASEHKLPEGSEISQEEFLRSLVTVQVELMQQLLETPKKENPAPPNIYPTSIYPTGVPYPSYGSISVGATSVSRTTNPVWVKSTPNTFTTINAAASTAQTKTQ